MIWAESYQELPGRVFPTAGDVLNLKAGNYEVKSKIGDGGFGTVYKVLKEESNSFLNAFKILKLWESLPTEYEELIHRFKQEFKIGKISSKNIVATYNMGFLKGNPYINMEYCANGALPDNMQLFDSDKSIKHFCNSVLSALNSLHKNGVVHRDIKPDNILFNEENQIKVTDFGISAFLNNRMTQTNFIGRAKQMFVSAVFSPPEQFDQGKYFNYTLPTMDIYAFGATLYFLLSKGKAPFGDIEVYKENPSKYIKRKKKGKHLALPVDHTLTGDWGNFINECLRPNPKDRFQSVEDAASYLGLDLTFGSTFAWTKSTSLEIVNGDNIGSNIDLENILNENRTKIIKLGRENDKGVKNDINLTENYTSYISKKHATIEFNGSDWFLRDGQFDLEETKCWLYSLNGIVVNNFKLGQTSVAKLTNGDLIRIGDFVLKFKSSNS